MFLVQSTRPEKVQYCGFTFIKARYSMVVVTAIIPPLPHTHTHTQMAAQIDMTQQSDIMSQFEMETFS